MKKRRTFKTGIILHIAIIFLIVLSAPLAVHAGTAQVLPEGVSGISFTYYNYFDIKERYDPDGEVEDIDVDYNTELNRVIDLSSLEAAFGLPAGSGNVGRSEVDFTLLYRWSEFEYAYGLTDKLTLSVLVPYNYSRNEIDAKVNNENANFVKNTACYNNPGGLGGVCGGLGLTTAPLIPLATAQAIGAPTDPLDTEDIQNYLGDGLDIDGDGTIDLQGFGYDRIETWSDSGVGDIELIAKYQFYNRDDWRLAATGGVRLPTGEVADPDSLVALPFGDGQTDILLRLHTDYLGIKKFPISATLSYDIQLPDKEEKRVPDDINLPITDQKDDVDRDLGDIFQLEMMGNYSLTREISAGLKYRYTSKDKDRIDGDKNLEYSSLENETDYVSHMAFVTLTYSTIQKYLDKEFSVPLSLNLTYRNRFAGKNNATKSEYVSSSLSIYF